MCKRAHFQIPHIINILMGSCITHIHTNVTPSPTQGLPPNLYLCNMMLFTVTAFHYLHRGLEEFSFTLTHPKVSVTADKPSNSRSASGRHQSTVP